MTNVFDLLSLDFMQRALMAAVFTGLAAPVVGTYLVQRRLALLGDGIARVAVTGVDTPSAVPAAADYRVEGVGALEAFLYWAADTVEGGG